MTLPHLVRSYASRQVRRFSTSLDIGGHSKLAPFFPLMIPGNSSSSGCAEISLTDSRAFSDEPEYDMGSKQFSSEREELFRRLQSLDFPVDVSSLDKALIVGPELPEGITPISIRASLIHYGRQLSSGSVITCLELFAVARIPDHMFFKEMGNALLPTVPTLSISDICRLLRAHASVTVTETELFKAVYSRLASIINRGTMDQIREILWSLSVLNASLTDCMRMAELCTNRYSLAVKEDSPLTVDKDVLVALAKLGMQNSRIIRKATSRILFRPNELSSEGLVECMTSLARLGSDVSPIYALLKPRLRHTSQTLLVDLLPALVNCFGVMDSNLILHEARAAHDTVSRFKSRFVLSAAFLLEDTLLLETLDMHDLKRIDELLDFRCALKEKPTSGCFVKLKSFDLKRTDVSGLFNTQLVELRARETKMRKPRKKNINTP